MLEDTPPAVCYATGMAAISGILLALLSSATMSSSRTSLMGARCGSSIQALSRLGIESSFVDTANPAAVSAASGFILDGYFY